MKMGIRNLNLFQSPTRSDRESMAVVINHNKKERNLIKKDKMNKLKQKKITEEKLQHYSDNLAVCSFRDLL